MGFKTIEQTDAVSLGGDEGQKKSAGGLLVEIHSDVGANHSMVYDFVQEDGEILRVWGATTIDGKLTSIHIGKFVVLKFKGMETGKSGRNYKDIEVGVWDDDDELSDRLKKWPRAMEFYGNGEAAAVEEESDEDLPF